MTTEQDLMFEDLIAEMFGNKSQTSAEGQGHNQDLLRFQAISNDFDISEDGMSIQKRSNGEMFLPALCNNEYFYVLPIGRGGKRVIHSAADLVFKAFTSPQYLQDLKKETYKVVYKDGNKNNPNYKNLQVDFLKD
jgi:hypothetical protein